MAAEQDVEVEDDLARGPYMLKRYFFFPSKAVLNTTFSAKAFTRPQGSYLNAVQEELRLGARCTLPRSKDSSAYPESYGSG